MTEQTDSTQGDQTETQTSGNQSTNQGTDWQEAYKGLQKKLSAAQAQAELWKNERDEARTNFERVKGDLLISTGKAEDLAGKVTGFETQVADLTAKVQGTTAELERSKLIMSDYQDLAKFEAKGLLPKADSLDELKEKLTGFREALVESIDKKVDEKLDGSSFAQEEETTDDDLSDDVLRTKMMDVAGIDRAEYLRLQKIMDSRSK